MEDIHIHHMTSAGKVCRSIVFTVKIFPNSSKYKSTRVDGLGIATRHLQDKCEYRRHDGNQPPTSLDSSTPFVGFRGIIRNIEFYMQHQLLPSIEDGVLKHTVDLVDVNELEQMLRGGEDKVCDGEKK